MTKIDFYILPDNNPETLTACVYKLATKIIKQKQLAYIQTQSENQSTEIVASLWHQTTTSFLPVKQYQNAEESFDGSWFGVGQTMAPEHFNHILINLSGQIPTNFGRFLRLLEIVPADHNARNKSREAYSYYQDRGYELRAHQL